MAVGKKETDAIRRAVEQGTAPLALRVDALEEAVRTLAAKTELFGEGPLEPVIQELRELRAEMRDNFRDLFQKLSTSQGLEKRVAALEKKVA